MWFRARQNVIYIPQSHCKYWRFVFNEEVLKVWAILLRKEQISQLIEIQNDVFNSLSLSSRSRIRIICWKFLGSFELLGFFKCLRPTNAFILILVKFLLHICLCFMFSEQKELNARPSPESILKGLCCVCLIVSHCQITFHPFNISLRQGGSLHFLFGEFERVSPSGFKGLISSLPPAHFETGISQKSPRGYQLLYDDNRPTGESSPALCRFNCPNIMVQKSVPS